MIKYKHLLYSDIFKPLLRALSLADRQYYQTILDMDIQLRLLA